jgi:hypothetical protein
MEKYRLIYGRKPEDIDSLLGIPPGTNTDVRESNRFSLKLRIMQIPYGKCRKQSGKTVFCLGKDCKMDEYVRKDLGPDLEEFLKAIQKADEIGQKLIHGGLNPRPSYSDANKKQYPLDPKTLGELERLERMLGSNKKPSSSKPTDSNLFGYEPSETNENLPDSVRDFLKQLERKRREKEKRGHFTEF